MPAHAYYEFSNDQDVAQIAITARNDASGPDQAPKDFTLAYSDDGENWTTALTVTNSTGWSAGETRTFNVP